MLDSEAEISDIYKSRQSGRDVSVRVGRKMPTKLKLVLPHSVASNNAVYRPSRAIDAFLSLTTAITGADLYTAGKRSFYVPPLNLMLLAAFLPEDIVVEIVDERIAPFTFDHDADIVGITCMTADAPRAYEIADRCRANGVSVVMGGIHPTVLPEEASQHADSIVIGEAETLISTILKDFQAGDLSPVYKNEERHNLQSLPFPRKDLIDDRYYITSNVIQATRGCPNRCSFCSIGIVSGYSFRTRPIPDVIGEIEHSTGHFFAFLDDNITALPQYAGNLFDAMVPCDIHWYGLTTVAACKNRSLLSRAARSGCKIFLIGFESLSQVGLNGVGKRFNNTGHYVDTIRRVHDAGIGVMGTFMLGLDGSEDDFKRIVDFANEAALDLAQVSILTPYPGTALYKQLDDAGRILTRDWRKYDTTAANVVFAPSQQTPEQLQQEYLETYDRLYSYSSIAWRLARSRRYPTFFIPYNLRQRAKARSVRDLIATREHYDEAVKSRNT